MTRIILRVVNLAPVRRLEATSSSPRGPRRRSQPWRALFSARREPRV